MHCVLSKMGDNSRERITNINKVLLHKDPGRCLPNSLVRLNIFRINRITLRAYEILGEYVKRDDERYRDRVRH